MSFVDDPAEYSKGTFPNDHIEKWEVRFSYMCYPSKQYLWTWGQVVSPITCLCSKIGKNEGEIRILFPSPCVMVSFLFYVNVKDMDTAILLHKRCI